MRLLTGNHISNCIGIQYPPHHNGGVFFFEDFHICLIPCIHPLSLKSYSFGIKNGREIMIFPLKNILDLEFTTASSRINMRKTEYGKNMFSVIKTSQF